jgi:HAD superfamily hydrolase (TIGR01509 family)
MGGVTASDLDALTLDAYGTLLELDAPVTRLRAALAARGAERSPAQVEHAFGVEIRHYRRHMCGAASADAVLELQRECCALFLEELDLQLDFTREFVDALVFRPLPGVAAALASLRARGLALAVVSNWDAGLSDVLAAAGLSVDAIVTCAEVGAAKPDPRPFTVALHRLGVAASRALHVGDSEADRQGAAAAGVRFVPAPLAEVTASL